MALDDEDVADLAKTGAAVQDEIQGETRDLASRRVSASPENGRPGPAGGPKGKSVEVPGRRPGDWGENRRDSVVSRETPPGVEVLGTLGEASLSEVPLDRIIANPDQPRQVFDEEALDELAASLSEVGVLQPIVVRPLPNGMFEIVMGERRYRAATRAKLKTITAIVRETSDADMLRDALLENLHRVQLNPLEEAAAYQQMLEEFGCTQEDLASRLHRSRPQIANMIRLLKLPASVQRRVAAGTLSAGHARALLRLDNSLSQERLAQRIVAEGLSVRTAEEMATLNDPADVTRETLPRGRRQPSERANALSEKLSDHFETRVKVNIGQRKGRISIEFASTADLHRILDIMHLEQDEQS